MTDVLNARDLDVIESQIGCKDLMEANHPKLIASHRALQSEKETWGNEFGAVVIVKDQLALANAKLAEYEKARDVHQERNDNVKWCAELQAKLDQSERSLADAREQTANLLRLVETLRQPGPDTPVAAHDDMEQVKKHARDFMEARAEKDSNLTG